MTDTKIPLNLVSRRTVLSVGGATAAAVTLAACTPGGTTTSDKPGKPELVGTVSAIPVGSSTTANLGTMPIILEQPTAGTIVGFSAICTHMGCTVAANESGSEFDCPCHGSKYDAKTGAVINGPAQRPLAKLKITLQGDQIFASQA
jgi:Rieske Fe-S protein